MQILVEIFLFMLKYLFFKFYYMKIINTKISQSTVF